MSESSLTPHTAPRNLEGLLKETPFKLRLLAQALNGLTTEDQKMAWHQLQTPEARAEYVLALLKHWDTANPGSREVMNGATAHVGAQPTTMQQPMQMPPPQQMQPQYAQQPQQPSAPSVQTMAPIGPAQVSPQAAAAAAAATAAPSTTARKPRNSGTAAAPGAPADAEVATQVLSMLQTILAGLGSDAERFQKMQANITGILEEATAAKTGRLATLEAKYGEVANSLQHLSAAYQSQANIQIWTLMAFLTFMQESMGASMKDILGAAIQDSAMFQKLVDQALGKA